MATVEQSSGVRGSRVTPRTPSRPRARREPADAMRAVPSAMNALPWSSDPALFDLLDGIVRLRSLSALAAERGVSYRGLWEKLRLAERDAAQPLLERQRGSGMCLTPAGAAIWLAHAKLQSQLQTRRLELECELAVRLGQLQAGSSRPVRIHVSDTPRLRVVAAELSRAMRPGILIKFDGEAEGLQALRDGRCDGATLHFTEDSQKGCVRHVSYRRWIHPKTHRAIPLYQREVGLLVRDTERSVPQTIEDIHFLHLRIANTIASSPARLLLDQLLQRNRLLPEQIPAYGEKVFDESSAAGHVIVGEADVALGDRQTAQVYGLRFQPIAREHCVLVVKAESEVAEVWEDFIQAVQPSGRAPGDTADVVAEPLPLREVLPWLR